MTTTYKTFAHDRRRGWVAELVIEADDPARLWALVDQGLRELEEHGYSPLDPYAAPVASRVAANLAGQARPAEERSTSGTSDTAVCPVHGAQMTRRESGGKVWYSHRLNNGDWCNGKPARETPAELPGLGF